MQTLLQCHKGSDMYEDHCRNGDAYSCNRNRNSRWLKQCREFTGYIQVYLEAAEVAQLCHHMPFSFLLFLVSLQCFLQINFFLKLVPFEIV